MKTFKNLILGALIALCAMTSAAGTTNPTIDTNLLKALQADLAQNAGLTGKGIKVGVISAGTQGISGAEKYGALPQVTVVGNDSGTGTNEGTEMLEVVHQIAPDAKLYYCDTMAVPLCTSTLVQTYGVNIVVDDWSKDTIAFAPSTFSVMYDEYLTTYPALVLIHAAGNYYQTSNYNPWTPVTASSGGITAQAQDFGKAAGKASSPYQFFTLQKGDSLRVGINWSDDPDITASTNNNVMGVVILDSKGNVLASDTGDDSQGTVQASYTNSTSGSVTVRAAIGMVTQNNTNPLAVEFWSDSNISNPSPGGAGTEFGSSADTLSIGAAEEQSGQLENYSDQGPYLVYQSATLTGTDPTGLALFSYAPLATPVAMKKPDLTGIDCYSVDVGGFCGTSAAAPTVAGVMALLMQAADGTKTRAELYTLIESTGKHVVSGEKTGTWYGTDGYGLVQAWDAAKTLISYPTATIGSPATNQSITAGTPVSFSGSCAESHGTIKSYLWQFGDGSKSTQQDPGQHVFAVGGPYTVTFNCTDANGYSSPTPAQVMVTVSPPPPSKSGGGGMDILMLVGLATLLARKRGLPAA